MAKRASKRASKRATYQDHLKQLGRLFDAMSMAPTSWWDVNDLSNASGVGSDLIVRLLDKAAARRLVHAGKVLCGTVCGKPQRVYKLRIAEVLIALQPPEPTIRERYPEAFIVNGVKHGNITSYAKRGCRCDECRAAASEYYRKRRLRRALEKRNHDTT